MSFDARPSPLSQGTPTGAQLVGLALAACASLVAEVALTRIFSFTYWYHFAYLLIGVALLGVGAAGSLLIVCPRYLLAPQSTRRVSTTLVAACAVIVILVIVSQVPFDPAGLLERPTASLPLILLYVALLIPFLCTGLIVADLLACHPDDAPRIYAVDLIGAGFGCFLAVQLLWAVEGISTILASAGLFLAATLCFLSGARHAGTWAAVVITAWIVIAIGVGGSNLLPMGPAPGKAMHHFLHGEDETQLEFSRWTPINRVDVIAWDEEDRSRQLGMLSLWGMSPRYHGSFPVQKYIAQDGDACTSMYRDSGDPGEFEFLHHNILSAPYLLRKEPKTLIIGLGGGTDVRVALQKGASHITGVDINPVMVDLVQNRYREWTNSLYQQDGVEIHVAEGRSFVRRTDEHYDLIQLTGVDTLAALSSGAYVLSESYLYTVEAAQDLLRRLTPNGILTLTVAEEDLTFGGTLPTDLTLPRFTARLLSVLRTALEREGVARVEDHWVVLTTRHPTLGVKLVSILTKREPFVAEEIAEYRRFVEAMDFVSWYHPGMAPNDNPVSRFVQFEPADREQFFNAAVLDLRATTDRRPFFFNYYKWRSLLSGWELQKGRPGRSFAEGQAVLLIMLAQGIVFSLALIIVPLFWLRTDVLSSARAFTSIAAFFAALGFGFIFIEISLIQKLTLFLGYPTYSLSCVLAAMLVYSGLGSLSTRRLAEAELGAALRKSLIFLFVVVLLLTTAYPPLLRWLLDLDLIARVLVALFLLAPVGLTLGRFLPIGIRLVNRTSPALVPWGWAINGCASVVGTTLAVIMAITVGFDVLFLVSLAGYAGGVVALLRVHD